MVGSAPVDDGREAADHRVTRAFSRGTFALAFIFWTLFYGLCSPIFSNVVSTKGSQNISYLVRTPKHVVSVLSADWGNVFLYVEKSCGGSWRSSSGCRVGYHDESAAEIAQDSEPKLA